MFVRLNPSKATEVQSDPTVERCERRARALGYGGIRVTNIFAWRETDPKQLRAAAAPVGPDNDAALRDGAAWADRIIAGWARGAGGGAAARYRQAAVSPGAVAGRASAPPAIHHLCPAARALGAISLCHSARNSLYARICGGIAVEHLHGPVLDDIPACAIHSNL